MDKHATCSFGKFKISLQKLAVRFEMRRPFQQTAPIIASLQKVCRSQRIALSSPNSKIRLMAKLRCRFKFNFVGSVSRKYRCNSFGNLLVALPTFWRQFKTFTATTNEQGPHTATNPSLSKAPNFETFLQLAIPHRFAVKRVKENFCEYLGTSACKLSG